MIIQTMELQRIVKEMRLMNNVSQIIFNGKNHGKGYCIKKGIEGATWRCNLDTRCGLRV